MSILISVTEETNRQGDNNPPVSKLYGLPFINKIRSNGAKSTIILDGKRQDEERIVSESKADLDVLVNPGYLDFMFTLAVKNVSGSRVDDYPYSISLVASQIVEVYADSNDATDSVVRYRDASKQEDVLYTVEEDLAAIIALIPSSGVSTAYLSLSDTPASFVADNFVLNNGAGTALINVAQSLIDISGFNNDAGYITATDGNGIFDGSGSLSGATTVTLTATNSLTFTGGQTTFKGSGSTSATTALLIENSSAVTKFFVRDDGFISLSTATQSAIGEILGINGKIYGNNSLTILGGLGVGQTTEAPSNHIQTPVGWRIQLGSTQVIDHTSSSSTWFIMRSNKLRLSNGTTDLLTVSEVGFNSESIVSSRDATVSNDSEAILKLRNNYWDGAASQEKIFSINHNIKTPLTGESQTGFSIGGVEIMRLDQTSTATETRLMIYDVDNATLERVTVGAADSGGVGFKLLRIPN